MSNYDLVTFCVPRAYPSGFQMKKKAMKMGLKWNGQKTFNSQPLYH